ncbi:uncharacterized protein LOC132954780 [Labrus mixtus]|uniref:uncharacterized protein LOC132954780 n=1 Tax=Labrus mixtus TaxID=508554 RepID=UPI0029BFC755|nr:uncharacterized protein LOC132954780 [Labrus mixtus]
MPQNGMNYEGRRRGTRYNSCKVNGQVHGQVSGTDLVNGALAYNGFPAAATWTSDRPPHGMENGIRPQCGLNGYISHGYKDQSRKAVPPRTIRKQGSTISTVTGASASGRVIIAGIPDGISVNGGAKSVPCDSDQMTPQPNFPAKARNQRPRKKFKHTKRNTEVTCPEMPPPTPPPMMPEEEEDWEKEIQEVTLSGWEEMCFGNCPYGPEDLLDFSLRDLTLKQRDTVPPSVTANYSPAAHHRRPVRWSCYRIPSDPDQFVDADE